MLDADVEYSNWLGLGRIGCLRQPAHLIPFWIKVVINDLGLLLLPCGSKAEREKGEEKRKEIIINVNAHSTERDPWLLSTAVIHEALHFLHRRFKQNSCYLEHSVMHWHIIPHTHKQAMAPHLAR